MSRYDDYRKLVALGYTVQQAADFMKVGVRAVYQAEKRLGIQFRRVQPRGAKTIPAFTVKPEAIARYVAASKAKQSRQPRPGG